MWHGFAAQQATHVEEPRVLVVKLLVAVVGEHRGIHLVGNHQNETIAAPYCTGWRRNEFAIGDGFRKLGCFLLVDAVAETRVNDHGDLRFWILLHERQHGVIELLQTRRTATLGGKVAAIDHHMVGHRAGGNLGLRGYHAANV